FFQAEDGIRDFHVTGVQTCALPICMYLYNNHFEDIYLVDALKQYPFLLLIYNENMLLYQQPVLEILSAIDSIQRIDPIAIDNVKIGRASCRVRMEKNEVERLTA